MPRTALVSVSPVDGRYARQTEPLIDFFSEFALFKYRVRVEIEYLILFAAQSIQGVKPLSDTEAEKLREIGRAHV